MPVPLKVDPTPVEHDRQQRLVPRLRRGGNDVAGVQRSGPPLDRRPLQRRRIRTGSRFSVAVSAELALDVVQIDADVTESRASGRDGESQHDLVADAGRQPGDGRSEVHLGCIEDVCFDEWREHGDPVRHRRDGGHAPSPVTRRPSSRSLSWVTSAGGMCQVKTPCGAPSVVGTVAPVMPRTNRYAAPPRWVAGS